MTHRFDFHDSTAALDFLQIERLFLPSAGFEIDNALFRSGGIATGTLRYVDAATGEWVTEATWMNAMGVIGTGTPAGVPPVAPDVPDGGDFIGLLNGGASGFFQLHGVDAPHLNWDNTAEGADRDAALADFAANAAAAQADYQAQIEAVRAQVVQDRYGYSVGGTVMQYRPSDGTALTYGDFVGMQLFPGDGFYALGPYGNQSFGEVFAPDEAVEVRLTRGDDSLSGEEFSAGTLTIDAGRGDDRLSLFGEGGAVLPLNLTVQGGNGDDVLELGAFLDTLVDAGRGSDVVDLTFGTGSDAFARHVLFGGDGHDALIGAETGTHDIHGGGGRDLLVAGAGDDTLHGDAGRDLLSGGAGEDNLWGNADHDQINGDDGADTLNGGTGNDLLSGGDGADTFAFGPACGRDVIDDYAAGEAILIDAGFWSGSVQDFIAARVHAEAGGLVIRLGDGNRITLAGADPADLTDAIAFV